MSTIIITSKMQREMAALLCWLLIIADFSPTTISNCGFFVNADTDASSSPTADGATASEYPSSEPSLFLSSEIIYPPDGMLFSVGDILTLQGKTTDQDGDEIDDEFVEWDVRLYDDDRLDSYMTLLYAATGNTVALDPLPPARSMRFSETSFLRITYTATTSSIVRVVQHDIFPRLVPIKFESFPPGTFILLDGSIYATGVDLIHVWDNQVLGIRAPDQRPYLFGSWSNGGEQEQYILVSTTGLKEYQAFFILPTQDQASLDAPSDMPSPGPPSSAPTSKVAAEIMTPPEGTTFAVGDEFLLTGFAAYPDGEQISDDLLEWEVRLYDDDEESAYTTLLLSTGNIAVMDALPPPRTLLHATTAFVRIILTVHIPETTVIITRDIPPKTVEIAFRTTPPGTYILLSGSIYSPPIDGSDGVLTVWENQVLKIRAPHQRPYIFSHWSNGGDQEQEIVVSSTMTTKSYEAFYFGGRSLLR